MKKVATDILKIHTRITTIRPIIGTMDYDSRPSRGRSCSHSLYYYHRPHSNSDKHQYYWENGHSRVLALGRIRLEAEVSVGRHLIIIAS